MFYADGIHDDTQALQALLDQQGIVTLDRPGTYLVSKTLIIHSNTRFVLAPGAHLLAAPLSRCALIENEHFAGGGRDENIEIVGGIFDGNCDQMGLDAVYATLPILRSYVQDQIRSDQSLSRVRLFATP